MHEDDQKTISHRLLCASRALCLILSSYTASMKQTFNLTFKSIKYLGSCLEVGQIMFLEVFQANF